MLLSENQDPFLGVRTGMTNQTHLRLVDDRVEKILKEYYALNGVSEQEIKEEDRRKLIKYLSAAGLLIGVGAQGLRYTDIAQSLKNKLVYGAGALAIGGYLTNQALERRALLKDLGYEPTFFGNSIK